MTPATFTARGPEDLLALVPTVIGFHPEDSIVLLTFGPPGESFHARIDLPVSIEDQRTVTGILLNAVTSNAIDLAALITYTDDAAVAESQCQLLIDALLAADVAVIDAIRADGELYFAIDRPDDPGTPYDVSSHRFTAQRVLDGHVVHRSRAELADTLVGVDEEDAIAVSLAATRFADVLRGDPERSPEELALELRGSARWLQRRLRQHYRDHRPLSAADAGRALVLASIVASRDVAWAELTRASAAVHVELWRDLVRRARRDLLPGSASLLAFAAWLAGDGALSWCALDRCLEVDPDYSMAHTIAEGLINAVPPSTWVPMTEAELPIFNMGWANRAAS